MSSKSSGEDTNNEQNKATTAFGVPADSGPRLRRLRRCKSVSRAEEIVTEDEKQRRSQPDKPYEHSQYVN